MVFEQLGTAERRRLRRWRLLINKALRIDERVSR
jgi:hypothetical protein